MTYYRPASFPLVAQDLLRKFRASVYYKGGFCLVDVNAISKEEAMRIGIHYFELSNKAKGAVIRIEADEVS